MSSGTRADCSAGVGSGWSGGSSARRGNQRSSRLGILHRARLGQPDPDALVFQADDGKPLDRYKVRRRILTGAIAAANRNRVERGLPPIQDGITNHSLRRTYASLLYEAGASPAYVMGQMGHTSSSLALEVYARKIDRKRDTGAKMDELIHGGDPYDLRTPVSPQPAA